MSKDYEFTLFNNNGHVTRYILTCEDWLEANSVKKELLKSKNLWKVNFEII